MNALILLLLGLARPSELPAQPRSDVVENAEPEAFVRPLVVNPQNEMNWLYRFRTHWEWRYRQVYYDYLNWRFYGLFSLNSLACGYEHHLGSGWTIGVELGKDRQGFGFPVILNWSPVDGTQIGAGFDFLRMKIVGSAVLQ